MEAVFSVRWSVPWLYNASPLVANLHKKTINESVFASKRLDQTGD
jgi:hypothetical protein